MSQDCEIEVRFHEPPEDLRRFFTSFYYTRIHVPSGTIRDSLQPEWGGVRFHRGSTPVSTIEGMPPLRGTNYSGMGPTSLPVEFEIGSTIMWGIGFLPLGWATFMDVPAHLLADRIFDGCEHPAFARFLPLREILTSDTVDEAAEFDAIVHFFREELARNTVNEERVHAIHEMLLDPELSDVASMADRAGLSQRTLERKCRKAFGFPPKLLLRRQRFMRSIARFMIDPSLGWIGAMDSLYFDQSQFVRDCHRFLGMSPSEYIKQDHPVLGAFMRERQKTHGSAVQTLDKPG